MSVLDKFLNAMKLNDEDDLGPEGYLDDPDDGYSDETETVRRRIIEDRDEDDDPAADLEEEKERRSSSAKSRNFMTSARGKSSSGSSGSSVASRLGSARQRKRPETELAVCVIRPHSMEDAREITETLREKCAVVLNVENLELELAQRILDFTSGSCYAIDGNLQKISNYIFIITPPSIEISGDFQEILSGAFDVPFESQY